MGAQGAQQTKIAVSGPGSCPKGSACSNLQLPGGVKLPPHSIAVPLSSGAVSLGGLGPAPVAPEEPRPTWRTVEQAKAIVEQRLSEVILNLRTYKPVALPELSIEISIESVRLSKFSNDNIETFEKRYVMWILDCDRSPPRSTLRSGPAGGV